MKTKSFYALIGILSTLTFCPLSAKARSITVTTDKVKSATVTMKSETSEDTVTLGSFNNWSHTWKTDEPVSLVLGKGFNSHSVLVPETDDVSIDLSPYLKEDTVDVAVEWHDDGRHPQAVCVHISDKKDLYLTEADLSVVDGNDVWQTELPLSCDGLVSFDVPDGYVQELYVSEKQYVLKLYKESYCSVSGSVLWYGDEDVRPKSVNLELYKNGTLISAKEVTGGEYRFDDLPVLEDGQPVIYTVTETGLPSYYDTYETNGTFVNVYRHETKRLSGMVIWEDGDNLLGTRPESVSLYLLVDDEPVAVIDADANHNWEYDFGEFDKIDYMSGKEKNCEVVEKNIDGYDTTFVDGNILNTYHDKIPAQKIDVPVTIIWDGEKGEAAAVLSGYIGDMEVKSFRENCEGDVVFHDVPLNLNGRPVRYELSAESTDYDYETIYHSGTPNDDSLSLGASLILRKHTNMETCQENIQSCKLTNIFVKKNWEDNENQDGLRPDKSRVNLLANGNNVDSVVLEKANNWSHLFFDMPCEDPYGNEIIYTVSGGAEKGYVSSTRYDSGHCFLTDIHVPETIDLDIAAVWNDALDKDGIRPLDTKVTLLSDDEPLKTITLKESDEWKQAVTLPKYKNGKEICYSVSDAETPAAYTSDTDGNMFTGLHVVYTHQIMDDVSDDMSEMTSFSGKCKWDDCGNQDGMRPDKVQVVLYGDGRKLASKTIGENDAWMYHFDQLPVYSGDKTIVYSVQSFADRYLVGQEEKHLVFSYVPEKTDIHGKIRWQNGGEKPQTVYLIADDRQIASKKISGEDGWVFSFSELPKYHDGKEINYQIDAETLRGYRMEIQDTVVTNTYTGEKQDIRIYEETTKMEEKKGNHVIQITIILIILTVGVVIAYILLIKLHKSGH